MRLGWDEMRRRAKAFSEDWADAHYEKGETQSFYNDFFEIFGVKRRQVATYEQRVKLLNAKHGFMDLFWPKTLLIEQKSARLDLNKAGVQAMDYIDGIRAEDQPRYVLTCDFQTWNLTDLETGRTTSFRLAELHKHIEAFAFILGRRVSFGTQAAVNIKAAELMGRLHDALEAANYTGHDLEQLLVRLLFCLFADDTGIFEPKDIFLQLIEGDTREDGRDTGSTLIELFDILDCPDDKRQTTLRGELRQFPYVNGALFSGSIRTPGFDKAMRDMLLDACRFDWGKVSPAIFGSLFQSVMDAKERRAKGAHYTSEANILKVIGPLFLDDLKAEFDKIDARKTGRVAALQEFQRKLARLTFLDPACGCGNFLVVAYRELRALELKVLHALWNGQRVTDTALFSLVNVDQFYGIEYEEFPARIAEVAMWMADHLANNEVSLAFGQSFARIPLKQSARIVHGDALEVDWADVLPPAKCSYVMGNPPFVGAKFQSEAQRAQVRRIAGLGGSGGTLDYVAAWFIKAGAYLNKSSPNGGGGPLAPWRGVEGQAGGERSGENRAGAVALQATGPSTPPQAGRGPPPPAGEDLGKANHRIRIAFVSTNSITQGEQVAQLWPILFDRYHLEIAFAHRTFSWGSEARGKAHVHVVIIGLTHANNEPEEKRLFNYPDIKGDPVESRHGALTAYLFDARGVANRHLVVTETTQPLAPRPPIVFGNMPNDDGNLILSAAERSSLIAAYPQAENLIRPLLGAKDFIDGNHRFCLWLVDADPALIRAIPPIVERLRLNRIYRAASSRKSTQKLADYPGLFGEIRHTSKPFVLIPRHSSERREFVPFGFRPAKEIAHDSCLFLPDASLYEFAILISRAHMAWLAHIGGRLESRYRYSIGLVYNTFPWPDATPAQRAKIETLAQAVLDARANHPTSSLADLYDPDTMPADLRRAHAALDSAVDKLYRPAPFASDRDRVEHLFGRYEALVNPLERVGIAKNKRVAKRAGV